MNIYEYLKSDHAKVDKLFKQFVETSNTSLRPEIVEMIMQELILHAKSESATFYQYLSQFDISEAEVLHGEQEHKDIEDKIIEIATTENSFATWEKKVLELKELVEHHVKEEESEIFEVARKIIPDADALALKEKMHDYKEKLSHKKELLTNKEFSLDEI